MIFVLLGRRKALCLARHNRAKSAGIHRFKASLDLSLYPHMYHIIQCPPVKVKCLFVKDFSFLRASFCVNTTRMHFSDCGY